MKVPSLQSVRDAVTPAFRCYFLSALCVLGAFAIYHTVWVLGMGLTNAAQSGTPTNNLALLSVVCLTMTAVAASLQAQTLQQQQKQQQQQQQQHQIASEGISPRTLPAPPAAAVENGVAMERQIPQVQGGHGSNASDNSNGNGGGDAYNDGTLTASAAVRVHLRPLIRSLIASAASSPVFSAFPLLLMCGVVTVAVATAFLPISLRDMHDYHAERDVSGLWSSWAHTSARAVKLNQSPSSSLLPAPIVSLIPPDDAIARVLMSSMCLGLGIWASGEGFFFYA